MTSRKVMWIGVVALLATMALVNGCGGSGDIAGNPGTETAVVTGLKVYSTEDSGPYVVYGGTFVPPLLPGDCFTPNNKIDTASWLAIGNDPAGYGCVWLGQAAGTAEFSGNGYEYYVIKPLGDAPALVDALRLMGPDEYWRGWWNSRDGVQGFFSAHLEAAERMYGPANGEAAQLAASTADQASDPSGFILLPAHSWR